ncbi:hypothetical protein [Micromonospora sp. WMMD975]|uniref:hypothetical protein n=1 Tax=Micromonospora sp. WMMD975 TaxID=3016087 RepID=UPI00249A85DE|nr:hypothetical protein [Micromonospora sp. WMMD975]WFE34560.1 hypothetical protein O7613_04025 [Micromonospora sp. WMMD975]
MSLMPLARIATAVATLAALLAGAQPAVAHAAEQDGDVQMPAMFGHQRIDLAGDWRGARVCSVWRAQSHVECFADQAQADRRAATLRGTLSEAQLLASCSTPLRLFQDADRKGRMLQYFDRGYWQNIPLDFNDQMSSYQTGSCTSHLAEHSGGGGYWYPGYTGPNYIEYWVGATWDNRVSSIKND